MRVYNFDQQHGVNVLFYALLVKWVAEVNYYDNNITVQNTPTWTWARGANAKIIKHTVLSLSKHEREGEYKRQKIQTGLAWFDVSRGRAGFTWIVQDRWPNIGLLLAHRLRPWPYVYQHWANVSCLLGSSIFSSSITSLYLCMYSRRAVQQSTADISRPNI